MGDAGVYLASFISGLADVDAIALSVAGMSANAGQLSLNIAARAIVLAGLANTLLKGGVAMTIGSPELRRAIWPGTLLMIVVVTGLLFI